MWFSFIQKNILDVICVSIHYSNRYDNSEDFLYNHTRENVKKNILFLKTNDQTSIIDLFIKEYLIIDPDIKNEITWKNMHFLWKKFIENLNIPNMIYANNLKQELLVKLNFDNDTFVGITSKYLPNIEEFLSFWDENITHEIKDNFIGEFEISELLLLYNDYRISKNMGISDIEEELVREIIYHFMDNIEVEKDKFLLNVYSKLWDKEKDVSTYIQEYLTKTADPNVFNAYEYYVTSSQSMKFIVSKRFFEKCFSNYFCDY